MEASRKIPPATEQNHPSHESLLDTLAAIVWEAHAETLRFTFVSAGAERLLGYPAGNWLHDEEFLERHLHPADRDRVLRERRAAAGERRGHMIEFRMSAADGRVVWLRDHITVTSDGARLRGIMTDITASQTSGQEMESARARLRAVLDHIADGVVTADAEGIIQSFNHAAEKMFDYRAGEVLGRSINMLMPAAYRHEHGRHARHFLDSRVSREGIIREMTGQRRDGTTFPCEISLSKVHHSGKQMVIGVLRDITGRKRAARQLAEMHSRMQTFITASLTGVLVEEENRGVALANQSFCDLFGITATPESLAGMDGALLTERHKTLFSDPAAFDAGTNELIRQRAPLFGESLHLRDGRTLERDYIPVFAGHDFYGHMWQYRDITARRRAEEELKEARDRALAASRAKGEFLANISHEIRTPMTGILGMLELMQDTPLNSDQREYIDIATRSGEALLALLNDILDLSKIEAGHLQLEEIEFDPRALVEDVIDLLALRARSRGLELIFLAAGQLPWRVGGDPTRLRQVLTNLISNAIKFSQEGEILIQASVPDGVEQESRDKENGNARSAAESAAMDTMLRFEVTDRGIGIAPEAQQRIFEPFTQSDGSTTRLYGGTGLGLAICKRIVESMGGTIGVVSAPGKGSTFWFTVCLRHSANRRPAGAPVTALAGARILVIDGNPAQRSAQRQALDQWHMRHDSAANAGEGLIKLRAAASGDPYRLALVDQGLPDMSGLELAKRIRAESALAATRLILLTAVSQPAQMRAAMAAGMQACLPKPLRRRQLQECLTSLLSSEKTPAASDESAPPAALTMKKARLLIAEDNPVNQKVALGLLKKLGYHADTALDGAEALEALSRKNYDLVLMDCQMPGLDGYEAARRVRAQEGVARHTPIIAMTAHTWQGAREECLAAGMDDYLSKPLRIDLLRDALARWLENGQPAPAEEKPAASTMTETVDAVNEETLSAMRDALGNDFAEIVQAYLRDAPQRLAAMRAALERKDGAALRHEAHALKGSSGNLGAEPLSALCLKLEERGRDNATQDCETLLAQAGTLFQALAARLREEK